jgi:hypothetical protein
LNANASAITGVSSNASTCPGCSLSRWMVFRAGLTVSTCVVAVACLPCVFAADWRLQPTSKAGSIANSTNCTPVAVQSDRCVIQALFISLPPNDALHDASPFINQHN